MKCVGVDVGGTFTDLILMDDEKGTVFTHKVPSTPRDPSVGTLNGLLELCKTADVQPSEISLFFHGTTEATNIVIEHRGAKTGMITTKGFRDIVYIGRQKRYLTYSVQIDPPWQKHPLVLRRYRLPVTERIGADGKVLVPLDEEEVAEAIRKLKKEKVVSIAVCFLNSYINPVHEDRVQRLIAEIYPEAYVSLSHGIINQYREYERFNTTCLNAYIGPVVAKYIKNLKQALRSRGVEAELLLMQSSGGTASTAWAVEKPVTLLTSGPAAGLIAGTKFGQLAGFENIITLDVGGTSADIGVSPRGVMRYKYLLDTKIRGYHAMLPTLDVDTIGAGGGSVAHVEQGVYKVGPRSAGAKPGPACYGLGGVEPTVTDAHIVAGRLNPDYMLGGRVKVYPQRSKKVFEEKVCHVLGLKLEEAVLGAIRIVNHNMTLAMEMNSIGRGYDPRDFALVAFGGAGPLHACEIARELAIPHIVVPPLPGITSAIGLLLADVSYDYSMTIMQASKGLDPEKLEEHFTELEEKAYQRLRGDGFADDKISIHRIAECRYRGQSYELRVPLHTAGAAEETLKNLVQEFHRTHHREYGVSFPEREIEIVHIHVLGVGKTSPFVWKRIERGTEKPDSALKAERKVLFEVDGEPQWVQTPCYERGDLRAGNVVKGPAIVEQPDSTTLIDFGYKAEVDDYGNLIIKAESEEH
ncbi:hydantoinase/oxoprolinase family protein [Candidatus Hecatella orcuttiae]|uniref:hydantoinase/oxoprolinase family protein n=1 Tax=Candidatus Hecatella orcuttiae TaxID=1935119 RepID=UPI002867D942|nr:hydantoinase/oxoprolinase family protein [Candidatus Hecatella orcuttiae]